MRFLAAVVLGAVLGAGAVLAVVHDYSAPQPTPTRAVFHNLSPYKPPPTRSQYNFGSGG